MQLRRRDALQSQGECPLLPGPLQEASGDPTSSAHRPSPRGSMIRGKQWSSEGRDFLPKVSNWWGARATLQPQGERALRSQPRGPLLPWGLCAAGGAACPLWVTHPRFQQTPG